MNEAKKRKESAEIERLTQEYLDRGGEITQCDAVRYVPAGQEWMLKHNIDYTPWSPLGGGSSWIEIARTQTKVSDGGYVTRPAPFLGSVDR